MNLERIRMILAVLAGGLVFAPILIVNITGKGFSPLVSRILISISMVCLIAVLLLGLNPKEKNKLYVKIGVSAGLLFLLLMQWL